MAGEMLAGRFIAAFGLITLLVAGCTAVPDPIPTPKNSAGEVVTVEAVRPLPTATLIPLTPTPTVIQATETAVPFPTDLSIPTNTIQPSTSPTPTLLARFTPTWATNVNEATVISTNHIFWSPTENQFVFSNCLSEEHTSKRSVFTTIAPNFQSIDMTPSELVCGLYTDVLWNPDGQFFLLSATPNRPDFIVSDDNSTWKIDRDGKTAYEIELVGHYPNLVGWFKSNLVVQEQYSAGGQYHISITDIETSTIIAEGMVHASTVKALTPTFVVTNDGMQQEGPFSAAALSTEIVNPENEEYLAGPYLKYLSQDYPFDFRFNSRFEDILPGTNQVLVQTWGVGEYLTDTIHTKTDLQLWDLDTDELNMLIPGGFDGQFSPDGHYLVYTTYGTESPPLYLLDRSTNEILLTQPYGSRISFSPNGRFLTFYSPTPELMLYDLENGAFLPPLTAVPFTPLWSPDGSRFVYQHPTDGLSIFDTRTNTAYPLATSGGERLSDPQWSYDGTYLSVTVEQEEWNRDTAVLQLP